MASRYVRIKVKHAKKETQKAMLCVLENDEEVWIPFSQMEDESQQEVGEADFEMSVTRWLAEQNEWDVIEDDDEQPSLF